MIMRSMRAGQAKQAIEYERRWKRRCRVAVAITAVATGIAFTLLGIGVLQLVSAEPQPAQIAQPAVQSTYCSLSVDELRNIDLPAFPQGEMWNKLSVYGLSVGSLEPSRMFMATAYTQCGAEGTADGVTFTGLVVDQGLVAVDPNIVPLGSVLWVQGYGYGLAADIGGGIQGKAVDVFMHCKQEAREFGRSMREVRVILAPQR